ncbi:DUF4368 domain-containing protein [Hungatella sp.]|uniref:DUF4368 domain-containing protein n=1 Tax=Hungatella sp. TaxID=2613924 RepID=UPI003995DE35
MKNLTDYLSVFTKITPTERFLTADFKCSPTITNRSRKNWREKLLQLNEEIIQQEEQAENIDKFIGKVRKYLDLDELTPTVLNDMVKAVYVHAPDKSSGHREQQIDISYDLVGILPASLLGNLSNGETA